MPSWCYPYGEPKMCPCGHHEGYHADDGECLMRHKCQCRGLPKRCRTTDEQFEAERRRGERAQQEAYQAYVKQLGEKPR